MHDTRINIKINSSKYFSDEIAQLETEDLSPHFKELIRSSWKIILSDLGQTLCFVGGPTAEMSSSLPGKGPSQETATSGAISISSAFIKLFEEYPQSQEFFTQFKGTPVEKIKSDLVLSKTLEDHSVRVFQLVEKVIARMEPSIEKVCFIIFLISKIISMTLQIIEILNTTVILIFRYGIF